MTIFEKTPTEILYLILQYAGELRILKRKMTKTNMLQILNDDNNNDNSLMSFACDIVDRPVRNGVTGGYIFYWNLLNKISNTEEFFITEHNYVITDDIVDKLKNIFINDYNNYYLDDDYYNKTWVDGVCYTDFENNIIKETKHKIERYRHDIFDEIQELVISVI